MSQLKKPYISYDGKKETCKSADYGFIFSSDLTYWIKGSRPERREYQQVYRTKRKAA